MKDKELANKVTKVTKGNVFKDLGFTDEESIALAMRVDLAVEKELADRVDNAGDENDEKK